MAGEGTTMCLRSAPFATPLPAVAATHMRCQTDHSGASLAACIAHESPGLSFRGSVGATRVSAATSGAQSCRSVWAILLASFSGATAPSAFPVATIAAFRAVAFHRALRLVPAATAIAHVLPFVRLRIVGIRFHALGAPMFALWLGGAHIIHHIGDLRFQSA